MHIPNQLTISCLGFIMFIIINNSCPLISVRFFCIQSLDVISSSDFRSVSTSFICSYSPFNNSLVSMAVFHWYISFHIYSYCSVAFPHKSFCVLTLLKVTKYSFKSLHIMIICFTIADVRSLLIKNHKTSFQFYDLCVFFNQI